MRREPNPLPLDSNGWPGDGSLAGLKKRDETAELLLNMLSLVLAGVESGVCGLAEVRFCGVALVSSGSL